jgi:transposase
MPQVSVLGGEAVTRPTLRFVPSQELTQQDVQALHRARERWVKARTALMNEMRGARGEYGTVLPQGVTKFRHGLLPKLAPEQAKLPTLGRGLFQKLAEEWLAWEERLAYYNGQLEAIWPAHPVCRRLLTIPGIGPLTATALVAAVDEATHFKKGRQCAAWLGLVPRQHATGGKPRRLGLSTRGDRSRRTLLVHGARATPRWAKLTHGRRRRWIRALIERRGTNRAMVALAHTTARRAWVLLTTDQVYAPARPAA